MCRRPRGVWGKVINNDIFCIIIHLYYRAHTMCLTTWLHCVAPQHTVYTLVSAHPGVGTIKITHCVQRGTCIQISPHCRSRTHFPQTCTPTTSVHTPPRPCVCVSMLVLLSLSLSLPPSLPLSLPLSLSPSLPLSLSPSLPLSLSPSLPLSLSPSLPLSLSPSTSPPPSLSVSHSPSLVTPPILYSCSHTTFLLQQHTYIYIYTHIFII